MNYFQALKWSLNNFDKWFPKEVNIYEDEETFAMEIKNHPNPFCAERVRIVERKKSITKIEDKKQWLQHLFQEE